MADAGLRPALVVTCAVIVDAAGRVLAALRPRGKSLGGKWEFPGGKMEAGETGEECLRRELFEELGIHPGSIEPYHHQQHSYADSGAFDVTYYLVASFTGTLINRVFESTAWVPISQLGNYDILEGNMDVISKLLAGHETA